METARAPQSVWLNIHLVSLIALLLEALLVRNVRQTEGFAYLFSRTSCVRSTQRAATSLLELMEQVFLELFARQLVVIKAGISCLGIHEKL